MTGFLQKIIKNTGYCSENINSFLSVLKINSFMAVLESKFLVNHLQIVISPWKY